MSYSFRPNILQISLILVFSAAVNLLFLAGPLYMLQVYDRVLSARSEATLVVLSGLVFGLYIIMGYLDFCRTRIIAGMVETCAARMAPALFAQDITQNDNAVSDLDTLRRVGKSPVIIAGLDLIWAPFAVLGLAVFHPTLAYLALAGAVGLVLLAWIGHAMTARTAADSAAAQISSHQIAFAAKAAPETIMAQGMARNLSRVWLDDRNQATGLGWQADHRSTAFSQITKTVRLTLQSAVLGAGAYYVLQGDMTAGAMIAGSILLGRALAPVEQIIAGWANLQTARQAWGRLKPVLKDMKDTRSKVDLPKPAGQLTVTGLTVAAPDTHTTVLRGISFDLQPGQALGVIGPSGSGKSSLLRALSGVWPAVQGDIRLDGATLDQYQPQARNQHIGLLTQSVALFPGSIADNIARFDPDMSPNAVHKAAKEAGVHDLITGLPDGYNTQITTGQNPLSGGQMQRIALARALYRDPVLILLDEPNAALDSAGEAALNTALTQAKARGAAIVIMSHRPAAIAICDQLLVLDQGHPKALGPKDAVMRAQLVATPQMKDAA